MRLHNMIIPYLSGRNIKKKIMFRFYLILVYHFVFPPVESARTPLTTTTTTPPHRALDQKQEQEVEDSSTSSTLAPAGIDERLIRSKEKKGEKQLLSSEFYFQSWQRGGEERVGEEDVDFSTIQGHGVNKTDEQQFSQQHLEDHAKQAVQALKRDFRCPAHFVYKKRHPLLVEVIHQSWQKCAASLGVQTIDQLFDYIATLAEHARVVEAHTMFNSPLVT